MPIKQALTLILAAALAVVCCSRSRNPVPPYPGMTGASGSLTLTRRQMKELNLETAKIERKMILRTVECRGRLVLSASASVNLSAYTGGMLQSVLKKTGDYVRTGTLLAEFTSDAFLELQQEYLAKKSLLRYYQEEFKRQGELTLEDASSIKKEQKAEADFRTAEVDCMVLGEKLALMGIDADSLHIGNISSVLHVFAPLSGYLSVQDVAPGNHIYPGQPLFRISDTQHPYLKLLVPEQSADAVQTGQVVRFSFQGEDSPPFEAVVRTTGFEIDPQDKTLEAAADILNPLSGLLPGRTVFASVETGPDSAFVMPSKAVVFTPEGKYVMMKENRTITRIRVETGQVRNGLTEILTENDDLLGMDFVVAEAGWLNTLFGQR